MLVNRLAPLGGVVRRVRRSASQLLADYYRHWWQTTDRQLSRRLPPSLKSVARALTETTLYDIHGWRISDLGYALIVLWRLQAGGYGALPAQWRVARDDLLLTEHGIRINRGTAELARAVPVTSLAELSKISLLLRLSHASYQSSDEELMAYMGYGRAQLLSTCWTASADNFHPAFFVAIDPVLQAVVVSIRGTFSWSDALITFTTATESFAGGMVHRGMLLTARRLAECLRHQVNLAKVLEQHPGYGLLLVGHSLGGGVASILAVMLKLEFPSVRAHSFCAPACVSRDVASTCVAYVTSYINGDDITSRFHLQSAEALREQIHGLSLQQTVLDALPDVGAGKALTTVAETLAGPASSVLHWTASRLPRWQWSSPMSWWSALHHHDHRDHELVEGVANSPTPPPHAVAAAESPANDSAPPTNACLNAADHVAVAVLQAVCSEAKTPSRGDDAASVSASSVSNVASMSQSSPSSWGTYILAEPSASSSDSATRPAAAEPVDEQLIEPATMAQATPTQPPVSNGADSTGSYILVEDSYGCDTDADVRFAANIFTPEDGGPTFEAIAASVPPAPSVLSSSADPSFGDAEYPSSYADTEYPGDAAHRNDTAAAARSNKEAAHAVYDTDAFGASPQAVPLQPVSHSRHHQVTSARSRAILAHARQRRLDFHLPGTLCYLAYPPGWNRGSGALQLGGTAPLPPLQVSPSPQPSSSFSESVEQQQPAAAGDHGQLQTLGRGRPAATNRNAHPHRHLYGASHHRKGVPLMGASSVMDGEGYTPSYPETEEEEAIARDEDDELGGGAGAYERVLDGYVGPVLLRLDALPPVADPSSRANTNINTAAAVSISGRSSSNDDVEVSGRPSGDATGPAAPPPPPSSTMRHFGSIVLSHHMLSDHSVSLMDAQLQFWINHLHRLASEGGAGR